MNFCNGILYLATVRQQLFYLLSIFSCFSSSEIKFYNYEFKNNTWMVFIISISGNSGIVAFAGAAAFS